MTKIEMTARAFQAAAIAHQAIVERGDDQTEAIAGSILENLLIRDGWHIAYYKQFGYKVSVLRKKEESTQ